MTKFFDWLFDEKEAPKPFKGILNDDKIKEEHDAAVRAKTKFNEEAQSKFKEYVPVGPAYKIVQENAGHFVIQRRMTERASMWHLYAFGCYPIPAEKIERLSTDPREWYDTVKNTDAPIATKEYGYRSYGSESLTGYADLAFNIFADAEAYLFRMVDPAAGTTEYDFPPLKKRVVKKAPSVKKVQAK